MLGSMLPSNALAAGVESAEQGGRDQGQDDGVTVHEARLPRCRPRLNRHPCPTSAQAR